MRSMLNVAIAFFWVFGFSQAQAQSHAQINSTRSSYAGNIFVSQSVEGEYGLYTKIKAGEEFSDSDSRLWRGYGFRNGIGVELIKFLQISASHTFVNMRSKASSFETLHGSRFSMDANLVFASPVGNMEAGGGAIASKYDYQRELYNADFLGSGYYYSLGINHFISSKVSFFAYGKSNIENLTRNAGNSEIESIRVNTRGASVGFKLWL